MENTMTEIIPSTVTTTSVADAGQPNSKGNLTKLKIEEKGEVCGKPRFLVNSDAVINTNSGFKKKLLCDGPTFTAGHACAFSCTFCYVESMIFNKNQRLKAIADERGLKFEDMVVEIKDAPTKARKFLTKSDGEAKFTDVNDNRIIFASPLVDVAANTGQVSVTVSICKSILELTHWQIRLLSKSSLLLEVAKQIPVKYKNRVIYGLSTGTLDSDLAKSFEKGTALVSKRLATLKWLQETDYRTFGMVCPILPQKDYAAFAKQMAVTIDVEKCEHVWAEVINLRGDSLTATAQALRGAGYKDEANLLEKVMSDKKQWEQYARDTYEALAAIVPHNKLRFLQYVNKANLAWWAEHEKQGVVLLKHAAPKKKKKEAAENDNPAATMTEINHEAENE